VCGQVWFYGPVQLRGTVYLVLRAASMFELSDAISGFRLIAILAGKYDASNEARSSQPVQAIAQWCRNEEPCDDQYSERGVQNRSLIHGRFSGFRSKNDPVRSSGFGTKRCKSVWRFATRTAPMRPERYPVTVAAPLPHQLDPMHRSPAPHSCRRVSRLRWAGVGQSVHSTHQRQQGYVRFRVQPRHRGCAIRGRRGEVSPLRPFARRR